MAVSKDSLDLAQTVQVLTDFFPKSNERATFLKMTQGAQSLTRPRLGEYLKSKPEMAIVLVESLQISQSIIAGEV